MDKIYKFVEVNWKQAQFMYSQFWCVLFPSWNIEIEVKLFEQ